MKSKVNEPLNLSDFMTREQGLELLKKMLLTRAFEENAEEQYALGKLHGTMHLSIGQEAIPAGVASATKKGDYLLNIHRGHGHFLQWGGDLKAMMAEFMGKANGICRGRGGSMHIADISMNNLGAQGIVGGNMPISVGVGLSIQLRETDQVVVALFGDGAANEGAFHESLNMAAIWKLPVIYLCENNLYAMSMAFERAYSIEKISDRACAYNIPGVCVDGNDVLAVHAAVKEAAARARAGEGPTLIEAMTYRWRGHSKSDRQAYRTREEVKQWMEKDPIPQFAKVLGLTPEELKKLDEEARVLIREATEYADNSPEPDVDTIMEGLYA